MKQIRAIQWSLHTHTVSHTHTYIHTHTHSVLRLVTYTPCPGVKGSSSPGRQDTHWVRRSLSHTHTHKHTHSLGPSFTLSHTHTHTHLFLERHVLPCSVEVAVNAVHDCHHRGVAVGAHRVDVCKLCRQRRHFIIITATASG